MLKKVKNPLVQQPIPPPKYFSGGGLKKNRPSVPYTFDKGVTPLYVDTAALGRGRRETGEVSTKYDQSLLAEKILTGDQYLPAVEQALSWSARK